ncbi:hypothetical protein NDU88_002726 [Pleurodeles waltl]|uniref:Uncharacterized protein n=1 Tax=Pleurodeles waltl TaxID=8319 RepID=A0AAV7UBV8_PLEWA|nr:hypothetical protein NDU88_002726 [Pleurodeles waltl]
MFFLRARPSWSSSLAASTPVCFVRSTRARPHIPQGLTKGPDFLRTPSLSHRDPSFGRTHPLARILPRPPVSRPLLRRATCRLPPLPLFRPHQAGSCHPPVIFIGPGYRALPHSQAWPLGVSSPQPAGRTHLLGHTPLRLQPVTVPVRPRAPPAFSPPLLSWPRPGALDPQDLDYGHRPLAPALFSGPVPRVPRSLLNG